MTARNKYLLWRTSGRLSIFILAVALGLCANAQEEKSKPARSQDATPQIDGPNCNRQPNCVDVGSYTATATEVWRSLSRKSREIRVILRFENVSDGPIILAYRAHSMFVLDDFGNRYFCCLGPDVEDSSAIGIGTDQGSKVDPQFMLKAHESAIASFDLWTNRQNPPASHYDIDVMIDEIDPTDQNVIQKHLYLPFRKVLPKTREPNQH